MQDSLLWGTNTQLYQRSPYINFHPVFVPIQWNTLECSVVSRSHRLYWNLCLISTRTLLVRHVCAWHSNVYFLLLLLEYLHSFNLSLISYFVLDLTTHLVVDLNNPDPTLHSSPRPVWNSLIPLGLCNVWPSWCSARWWTGGRFLSAQSDPSTHRQTPWADPCPHVHAHAHHDCGHGFHETKR